MKRSKIIIYLLLVIVGSEIAIRTLSSSLSDNIEHIEKIPEIVKGYSDVSESGSYSILFIGNSLTDHAVDTGLLTSSIQANHSILIDSYKIVPDGTSLWDWYCLLKSDIAPKIRGNTIVVVGYAWGGEAPTPSRLAGHFCDLTDLPELMSLGMDSFSYITDYLIGSISMLYVMKEDISKRILSEIIPYYKKSVRMLNEVNSREKSNHYETVIPSTDSKLVKKISEEVSSKGAKLVLMYMPVVNTYKAKEDINVAVESDGGVVLDYRYIADVETGIFKDPIHLNQKGRNTFTRRLASDLAKLYAM